MSEKTASFKKIYLDPKNSSLSEIMSNGKSYLIPKFQRDYSWEHDQWDELWEDIERMKTHKEQHFMGYLVFQTQTTDDKSFQIIDGQQRLTTISIIMLAAIAHLKSLIDNQIEQKENSKRIEIYRDRYVQVDDPMSLNSTPKLTLNRHNDKHFRVLTRELSAPIRRNIIQTNRNINKAFEFFVGKFKPCDSGESVVEILESIADGLLFTTITVNDDLNAYTVFETLNARGVHLSTPDLLKNYLLSVLAHGGYSDQYFDDFEEQWHDILEQLGGTEFTKFLRSYEGMRTKLLNKKSLFYALKKSIKESEQVFPYLHGMASNAPVYAALQDHNDSFWSEQKGQYTAAREYLETLRMFSIKTPLSLLMVGFQKLPDQEFIKLLQYITTVTIRYNVICSKPPNFQEGIYNQAANQLMQGEKSLDDVVSILKHVYPMDQEFAAAFAKKAIRSRPSNKKVFYLLRKIEKQLSGNEPPLSLTLEHVLPYSPSDEWQENFGRSNYDDAINRLGNIALLSKTQNLGQEPFAEKQAILAASPYKISQHIAEYSDWNMDILNEHQTWLATQAKSVWKISQFESGGD